MYLAYLFTFFLAASQSNTDIIAKDYESIISFQKAKNFNFRDPMWWKSPIFHQAIATVKPSEKPFNLLQAQNRRNFINLGPLPTFIPPVATPPPPSPPPYSAISTPSLTITFPDLATAFAPLQERTSTAIISIPTPIFMERLARFLVRRYMIEGSHDFGCCASAFASSLLEDLSLFSEPTATTVLSTETVIPVQATGAQRCEVLTLGDEVFTVAGLVSSLNLGAIGPFTAPTLDITLLKPYAVVSPGLIATETNVQPIQAIAHRGTEDESAVDILTFTTLSPGKPPVSSQNSLATITAGQDIATLTLTDCGTAPGGLIKCAQTTFSNCVISAGDQTCNGQIPSSTSTTSEVQSFLRVVPTTLQRGGDIITTNLISGLFRTTLQARASLTTEIPSALPGDFNGDDK
ncbi:hypothetical protein BCON_0305g00110 [Botryotinia convoluta]|uniref:FAS1 domain-containing protein n=1 Tax=Botryotinia convoluta TaxID=54673 RepID=A0A4Z1HJC0_9HELO|nr:hypothetical protein BCON_0305g00110 [Botryotinia convoluta]